MKKTIGIIALILSTSIFSQDLTTENLAPTESISAVQTVTINGEYQGQITSDKKKEFKSIVKDFEQTQVLIDLDIQEVNLKIHREMLENKPNLKTINQLIDKKSSLIAKLEKNVFEINFKIKDLLNS